MRGSLGDILTVGDHNIIVYCKYTFVKTFDKKVKKLENLEKT